MIYLAENWKGKWGVYPNLGIGEPSPDGKISDHEPMDKFIAVMEKAIDMRTSVVGACCGSTPVHIKELSKMQNEYLLRFLSISPKGVNCDKR